MTSNAPAKIILFGEHAVVYGYPAIAVPFSAICITAEATSMPDGSLVIFSRETNQEYRIESNMGEMTDPLAFAAQLNDVTPAELGEPTRLVPEPCSELGARRQLLFPLVELGPLL